MQDRFDSSASRRKIGALRWWLSQQLPTGGRVGRVVQKESRYHPHWSSGQARECLSSHVPSTMVAVRAEEAFEREQKR